MASGMSSIKPLFEQNAGVLRFKILDDCIKPLFKQMRTAY